MPASRSAISTPGWASRKSPSRVGTSGSSVGRHHPHRHAALHEPREVVDRVADARDGRERRPGVREHRRPDRGRAHAAGAIEQLVAELALEAADLRAHARLGDVQPLRGAREAPFVGDGDEVLELAQLHNGSF